MSTADLFSRLASIDNLRSAWIKAKQYAITEEIFYDSYAYEEFEEHLETKLTHISNLLLQNIYIVDPYQYLTIPKGNGQRKITFLHQKIQR